MAERLDHFKKYYRARFCGQGGKKINIQPGQNVLKYIQDCFECKLLFGDDTDVTISSPNATCSSTPLAGNQERTSTQSPRPNAGLTNVAEDRTCPSAASLPATPADTVRSKGEPCVFYLEPERNSHVADSIKTDGPVPRGETQVFTLKDVEVLCGSPAKLSDPEDDHGVVGSPLLVEEAKTPPVQMCTVSRAPSSPPPVKDQDVEIESECEFLIDESGDLSFKSWFSIPRKNRKSKKDGSASPVLKSQSSEKEKTADKKCKNIEVQAEVHSEQKMQKVRVQRDLKGGSETHPVSSDSERKVLKSQMRSSTRVGKSKKDALNKGSPKHRKKMSYESEAEQLMLSGLDSEASDEEKKKRRVMPREDLPVPSAEHQQEQMLSPKKNVKPCKYQQSASKAYQRSVHKKQTKQKLANDKVLKSQRKKLKKSGERNGNKNSELQRWESSDSEPGVQGLEGDPLESNEMFTSPPHQELQTSVLQKLAKSEKAEKVLHALETVTGVNNKTPLKAAELLQHLIDRMQNSEKKRSSAVSSGKMLKKVNHRAHKRACSNTEDTEPQNTTDSDSSSAQEVARKKCKQSAVKTSKKRESNRHQRLQDSSAAEKAMNPESRLVLEHSEKYTSRSKHCEENNESSDNSEDLQCQIKNLLSDEIGRQKIVLPSNTPNVRRTKRIRLKPLEYWRGERVTYTLKPSGRLLISGIAGAEAEPHRNNKQKSRHKQKRAETRSGVAECLDIPLADASKPTSIVDPVTNQEVLLVCINSGSSHSCFFEDESIKVYKSLNTSDFAAGKLILKPLKEKGHQFVHMDTIAFYVIRGQIIVTLHKTSYYLTSGDYFYVPAGNGYNIRNLLNEESVLHFTQLKNDSPALGIEMPLSGHLEAFSSPG
ncbi:centromere protein C isoform X2 [Numida meleagris]|uniref:centromere protein C isoform X2 n=1 Tax=Numida meleagris TaxID=8996 RepID=UPI000B3E331C|nr:centromere protein C isoform X2 [Numida meleagris]